VTVDVCTPSIRLSAISVFSLDGTEIMSRLVGSHQRAAAADQRRPSDYFAIQLCRRSTVSLVGNRSRGLYGPPEMLSDLTGYIGAAAIINGLGLPPTKPAFKVVISGRTILDCL